MLHYSNPTTHTILCHMNAMHKKTGPTYKVGKTIKLKNLNHNKENLHTNVEDDHYYYGLTNPS